MTPPRVSFWITSTGRECAISCARETVKYAKGLDSQFLIFESRPENPHGTVEAFKALDVPKKVWTGAYPPLGWIYNLFMEHSGDYFIRLDDDCWPVCDAAEMVDEAIRLLEAQPVADYTVSNVPLEMNPRLAVNVADGSIPEGANRIPKFPWNETCHWRQTELYHILDGERRQLLSAYMLKWWGIMGHFSGAGVDGVSRARNLNAYCHYVERGYVGRRPQETWGTAFLGTDLPQQGGTDAIRGGNNDDTACVAGGG